jgi:hypothetical protein
MVSEIWIGGTEVELPEALSVAGSEFAARDRFLW